MRLGASEPIGAPAKRTRSAGARSRPVTARSSVDLPAPLAPMMATVSPSSMREVDAVERLEIAVERGEPAGPEQAHAASMPR